MNVEKKVSTFKDASEVENEVEKKKVEEKMKAKE